jgi:hypothetical protein
MSEGREICIKFFGIKKDIPQFEIKSDEDSPIVGNQPRFFSFEETLYGQTLFYEPIPFDFLYTNETSPQVIVHVDGIEAVCDSLNCNYEYIAP